jgi:hypothetical protein
VVKKNIDGAKRDLLKYLGENYTLIFENGLVVREVEYKNYT